MKNTFIWIFLLVFCSKSFVFAQSYTSPASFSFTNSGYNTSFTTNYILVNTTTNLIAYTSSSTSFSGVTTGTYSLYAVNYDPSGTAPTLTVGTALGSIGDTCVALSSALAVTVTASTSQSFVAPASFSFSNSGNNTALTTIYVLVNSNTGLIAYSSSTTSFSGVSEGTYTLYGVNYDASGTVPTLTVGTSFSSIGGSCVAFSSTLSVTVTTSCLDNPTLPDYTSGTTTIKAPTTITATNKVSTGATVTYQSGGSVTLSVGFQADSGSVFTVKIAGCNN